MPYIQITRVQPSRSWRHETLAVVSRIVSCCLAEEGCLFQGSSDAGRDGEMVLVGLWADRAAAAAAAGRGPLTTLLGQLACVCDGPLREEGYEVSGGFRVSALSAGEAVHNGKGDRSAPRS